MEIIISALLIFIGIIILVFTTMASIAFFLDLQLRNLVVLLNVIIYKKSDDNKVPYFNGIIYGTLYVAGFTLIYVGIIIIKRIL